MEQSESDHLEHLRIWRRRRERERSIGEEIERLQLAITRNGKRLGEIIDAWEDLLPAHLHERTRIAAYRAGTIHVIVESSAVLYEVDRLLREGVEADLRRRVKGTVARVRLTVGPVLDPSME